MSFVSSKFSFHSGSVGIGTHETHGYKLAVLGGIIAESVRVKLHANWPDFVFDSKYNLMSLKDTEDYIKANRHLPNVPSAACVKEEGIDVSEMNIILLRKIEELTLYLLEHEYEMQNLRNELANLKSLSQD